MNHPYDPDTDPAVAPRDAPPRGGKARRVPPLVWIILGLLALIVVVGIAQYDGERTTPSGETVSQANVEDAAEAVMPAAPPPVTNTVAP